MITIWLGYFAWWKNDVHESDQPGLQDHQLPVNNKAHFTITNGGYL